MKFKLMYFLFFGAVTICSCTQKPELKNMDLTTWKEDKGGCLEKRAGQIEVLKSHKQALKGTNSNDILSLLGPPDIQRLSERNQEYFVYFLEKGPHCGSLKPISNARSVIFRFSAIKLVTEVTFQNGSI